jgi:hypothetical protein
MFIIYIGEMHFLIDTGDNLHNFARLPVFFDASPQLGQCLIIGPDIKGISRPGSPTCATQHAQFGIGMIVLIARLWEHIGETHGQDAIPEITPREQITDNTFPIQLVISHLSEQFQMKTLNFIDAFLCMFLGHCSLLPLL